MPKPWTLALAVAALGAVALRLVAVNYGLPAVYNPDEIAIMSRALDGPGPRDVEDWTDDRTMIVIVCKSAQRRTCSDDGSCDASQPPPSAWINDTLATNRLV